MDRRTRNKHFEEAKKEMAGASTVGGGRGGAMMGRDKETRKRRDKKKELQKVSLRH